MTARIYRDGKKIYVKRNGVKERWLRRSFLHKIKEAGCQICGFTNVVVIELHHIDKKHGDVLDAIHWADRETFLAELSKCVPVCANCHKLIHAGQLVSPLHKQLQVDYLRALWEETCTQK